MKKMSGRYLNNQCHLVRYGKQVKNIFLYIVFERMFSARLIMQPYIKSLQDASAGCSVGRHCHS